MPVNISQMALNKKLIEYIKTQKLDTREEQRLIARFQGGTCSAWTKLFLYYFMILQKRDLFFDLLEEMAESKLSQQQFEEWTSYLMWMHAPRSSGIANNDFRSLFAVTDFNFQDFDRQITYPFTVDELAGFLEKELPDGKCLYITAHSCHATCLFKESGKYYFYNPCSRDRAATERPSTDVKSLAQRIQRSHSFDGKKYNPMVMQLSILSKPPALHISNIKELCVNDFLDVDITKAGLEKLKATFSPWGEELATFLEENIGFKKVEYSALVKAISRKFTKESYFNSLAAIESCFRQILILDYSGYEKLLKNIESQFDSATSDLFEKAIAPNGVFVWQKIKEFVLKSMLSTASKGDPASSYDWVTEKGKGLSKELLSQSLFDALAGGDIESSRALLALGDSSFLRLETQDGEGGGTIPEVILGYHQYHLLAEFTLRMPRLFQGYESATLQALLEHCTEEAAIQYFQSELNETSRFNLSLSLKIAAQVGACKFIKLVLSKAGLTQDLLESLIMTAVESNQISVFNLLYGLQGEASISIEEILVKAVRAGHYSFTKYLVETYPSEVEVDTDLLSAIYRSDLEKIIMLIDSQNLLSKESELILAKVIKFLDYSLISKLLSHYGNSFKRVIRKSKVIQEAILSHDDSRVFNLFILPILRKESRSKGNVHADIIYWAEFLLKYPQTESFSKKMETFVKLFGFDKPLHSITYCHYLIDSAPRDMLWLCLISLLTYLQEAVKIKYLLI